MLRSVIETKKEKLIFQVFFLKNEDEGVEVIEVEEIDFEEVKRRIEDGQSVFITRKQEPKAEESRLTSNIEKEPWYISRV
jgi:hypothetical protein